MNPRETPESQLLIIDRGLMKKELNKAVKESSLRETVHFLGPMNPRIIASYYTMSDIIGIRPIIDSYGDTGGMLPFF